MTAYDYPTFGRNWDNVVYQWPDLVYHVNVKF